MSEQYRFMRYYLPGSLFLIYIMILMIPELKAETIKSLSNQAIIGIFTGVFVASPIIGYIIYGFYNHLYERWAMKSEWRPALEYIEDLEFEKDPKLRKHYKKMINCNIQKKEFLDLIFHSTLETKDGIRIDSKILETLKAHVSNFNARVVCGIFVPFFSFMTYIVWRMLNPLGLEFNLSGPFSSPALAVIVIITVSICLLWDCQRVLFEAYQLEAFFIKAKKKEVKELLKNLFTPMNAICPKCKKHFPSKSKFCSECGTDLQSKKET